MTAPLPPNEEIRLQTLARYQVLGTAPEPVFDHLTSLAARVLRVPVVLISLVGEKTQWLKSHHGWDVCETARGVSFCAHALLLPPEEGVFVVPDATQDARFADNPLVTGQPGVRFYAGAPLRTADGQVLGSFCVVDTIPRSFSEEDRVTLAGFAATAMETLELRLAAIQQQDEVAERRRAQQELEDSHTLFSAVVNGTTDAVFLKDLEGRYVLINPAGAAFFGVPAEEVIGCTDEGFFSPEAARHTRENDLAVMEAGCSRTFEDDDVVAGQERTFLVTKSPYRDAAGGLLGVIGIARETTEQRRAAEALLTAKEEAERANNAKSEFLSRMSHELRTPLNAILGFGQLLELHDLPDNEVESVNHILKAGRHLLKLIDEVLAISRIEAGHLHLSVEPVALSEITTECLSLVYQMAAEQAVRCEDLCQSADRQPGAYLLADRQRLRQVLLNLLSNAIKYNRAAGRVSLSCERVAAPGDPDGEKTRLRLSVTDTGVGLSQEEIGRLFTPFDRLKAEHTQTEGTGLGLALSKGLVEAMGGTIGVRSTLHEGSEFWVELPVADDPLAEKTGATHPAAAPAEPTCQGTVLYIEDNFSNTRLMEMLLEAHPGVELLGAEQGSLGLEIARCRQPDLILLDLHLPDVPGWDVLAALQADPRTRDIPTVIVSADATPNQIARLRQGGARDYLTKPINVRAVMALLREHLQNFVPVGAAWAVPELPVLTGSAP